MELPDVGKHCSYKHCNRLDFLPIECPLCKLQFCKDHIKGTEHKCTKSHDNTLTKEQLECLDGPASYECSIELCKGRELTPIECDKCKQRFCLKHRLPGDHDCSAIEKKEPKPFDSLTPREKVEKITGKSLNSEKKQDSGRVGKRSKKTSSKVIELKLKMKAKGENNIPVDERIYFNVTVIIQDGGGATKEYPLFFSREYTIGKMIDLTATYCALKNQNHVTTAPKLRFFVTEGDCLPTDKKLGELLVDPIANINNFGELFITYVDE